MLGFGRRDCEWLGGPVVSVPVLGRGSARRLNEYLGRSRFSSIQKMEGLYLKQEEGGRVLARYKFVSPEFLQTVEEGFPLGRPAHRAKPSPRRCGSFRMSAFPFVCPAPPEWSVDWPALTDQFAWIRDMRECPQDAIFHAEGDVWRHVGMVCQALASFEEFRALPETERHILLRRCLVT